MKYVEPEMLKISFDDGVYTDDFIVASQEGGNDGEGDIGEGDFSPLPLGW